MKKNSCFLKLILLIFTTTLVISCNNDDDNNIPDPLPTGEEIVYDLTSVGDSEISGTATVIELDDNSITVELRLLNTVAGGLHPAHIHLNTAAETGAIAITLGTVDGATGFSTINFSTLDDDITSITYDQLLDFNGYINVHQSAADLATLIAQGDIGQNELTGESTTYELLTKDAPGISGTATLEERKNGTTLVTLSLEGTTAGGVHPAHIHEGEAASDGDIVRSLNSVDGTTGMSKTQVASLDDDTSITYTQLLAFDGYINVHQSAADLGTLIAQGNIGSNAGPLADITYTVTHNGETAYIFNGNSLVNASNPAITLKKGRTYKFTVNAPGHPFWIKTVQGIGTGNAFSTGVTNNGATNGTVTFIVPQDAPATLYYNCEIHAAMTNAFTIID